MLPSHLAHWIFLFLSSKTKRIPRSTSTALRNKVNEWPLSTNTFQKKRMKFIDFNIRYCKNEWQYSTYSKLLLFAIRGCCTSLKKVMSSLIVKRYSEFQKPSISFKGSKSGDVQNLFRENVFYCMKIIIYFQMRDLASFWTKQKHAWGNSKTESTCNDYISM